MTEPTRSIQPTGVSTCEAAGRVGDVHVLGVFHSQPLAIARLTGAVTRYEPDVVAVEACADAISQYHPDIRDARWPPAHEVEAAAFMTDHLYDLLLAGIDTQDYDTTTDFEQLDREIFTELGCIDSPEQLTRATYYELDCQTIRQWRDRTKQRAPDAFETVLSERDTVMAGHLHALSQHDEINTIVAAVGIQHLTGILDRLQIPSEIPEEYIEVPPLAHYRLFPRESPHSKA